MSTEIFSNPPAFLTPLVLGLRVLLPVSLLVFALWKSNAKRGAAIVIGWLSLVILLATSPLYSLQWVVWIALIPPLLLWCLRHLVTTYLATLATDWLIGLQIFRCLGAMFVLLWLEGLFPAYFALPVGVGDLLVGLGAIALLLLRRRQHLTPNWLWLWCVFGIADHLVALAIGGYLTMEYTELLATTGETAKFFPLNLLPLFVVPFSICLHILLMLRILAKDETKNKH